MTALLLIFLIWICEADSNGGTWKESTIFCRDSWIFNMTYEEFEIYSCSKCYVQMFMNDKPLKIIFPPTYPHLLYQNMSDPNATVYSPDPDVEHSEVCAISLTDHECKMWKDCCWQARHCCRATQQMGKKDRGNSTCPSTWDGITCWPATDAGHLEMQSCPSYYVWEHVTWTKPHVSKYCELNGQWQTNEGTLLEFSDYDKCFNDTANINILRISLYIDFTGNGISIIFLVTSIVVILCFRELRSELQQRTGLKIHFNLFVSVLCTAIFTVSFHSIYHDAFTNSDPVYQHNAIWCRALHIMTKYFKSTTYMCMFCEGLFLYRRISQVMQIGLSEALLKYLLISWVLPLITVGTYVIVMLAAGNTEKCWIDDNGLSKFEFIHMTPNLLSLVCNLVFLLSIQYMLCTKMRSDTSDRRVEVLRHAIRATMSLIPIFGLQFLFLIYRPKNWPPYEIIVAIFQSTQGTLVAILYCFTTREVKTVLASHLQSCRRQRRRRRNAALPAFPSSKTTRLTSSSRQKVDYICSRVQRMVSKRPAAVTVHQSLPDIVDCGEYLDVNDRRRDSAVSKLTQRSFVDVSGTYMNSQQKVDLCALPFSKKNGVTTTSIQMDTLDVKFHENGSYNRRNIPSPTSQVKFQIEDSESLQTMPLMETSIVNAEICTVDKPISPILSPILEGESHSNTSTS